jgi:rSAM-associated Gly-rich repeat protein
MKRSLIAFQALLASSAVLCQTAEASSTYTAPEYLNGAAKANSINSIEARIEAVRNTD